MAHTAPRTLLIWVEWASRPDWTVADAADRVAASLRLIHRTWPEGTEAFKTSLSAKQAIPVDDANLAERLAPAIKASRNRNLFKDNDLFGDGSSMPSPVGGIPMSLNFGQMAVANRWGTGRIEVRVDDPLSKALVERHEAVMSLIAGLCEIWQARNGWIDMTHVRQQWNRWSKDMPVYGWATWLHPGFATVDAGDLDVDVTDAAGGGKLIVLRVDPDAMADSKRGIGKNTVQQLAARTVLADGRPLPEANPRLGEELQQGSPA